MSFNHKIFKATYFRIIDKQLALLFSRGRDTSGLFKFGKNEQSSEPSTSPTFWIGITTCSEGTWLPDPTQFHNWAHDQPHPPLAYIGGDCSTVYYNIELPGSGGIIPKQEQLPTGGSDGISYSPLEYPDADRLPEPWEETDEQGYYLFRKQELENLLQEDPFNVLNCDSLNIMPLDDNNGSHGLMFKRVAQKQVSPEIKARLDSIANVAPSVIFSPFQVQTLEDAYGPVVNCDYFAVHISTLPPGITPDHLLDYFRKHTNNEFVDAPSTGITFGPYIHGSFSDETKFYSSYEQSIGALVHIDLGPFDGTVVTSDYYRSQSPQPYKSRFVYSTISSPLDFAHPVSGNREFGIFANPGGTGYTFYTMGVDRTTNIFIGLGNSFNHAFNAADNLWKHMQQKMAAYINNNGGQAITHTPIIARPRWDKVEKYLRGQMTFSALKQTLGCQ